MSANKRLLLSLSLLLAFWVITFALSAVKSHIPIKVGADLLESQSNIAPLPQQDFLAPTSEIPAADMWTYECELVVQRPEEMTKNCADFGVLVRNIKWDKWSGGKAHGTGIYSENDCTPSCAEGKRHEMPVIVELSELTKVGKKYFLNTFSFSSRKGNDLPGVNSPDGSWDISEFYRMVPELHAGK